MSEIQEPVQASYPPAPWRSSGRLWMGLFKTDVPPPLPDGLKRLLNPNWLVVTVVRYLEGTLCYDELVLGGLARRGLRLGMWVYGMWVDDEVSLWGGRRIWGLHKEMADFAWEGNTVRISDEQGPITTLVVDRSEVGRLPKVWVPTLGLGFLDGQWTYTVASMWGRLARGGLRVSEWSERFPYRPNGEATFSLSAKPFRMTVPPPKILRD